MSKQSVKLILLVILSILGCQDSRMLTLKYSDKPYHLKYSEKEIIYEPKPSEIREVKGVVVDSKRPFVDSMSISQENTKTTIKLLENNFVPGKPDVRKVEIFHWTYAFGEPLNKGNTIILLFDQNGQLIELMRK